MFAPKRSNLARWCEKIELLQHVIYSKHGNWLKLCNFHLSQIIFSRIQQQDIPQVQITDLRSKSKIDNLPYWEQWR
jgi:expansin (peptidoglycan-binding protein)